MRTRENNIWFGNTDNYDPLDPVWGDPPAAVFQDAVEEVTDIFERWLGRRPTKLELRAGMESAVFFHGDIDDGPQTGVCKYCQKAISRSPDNDESVKDLALAKIINKEPAEGLAWADDGERLGDSDHWHSI
jgi:hypothetical protein